MIKHFILLVVTAALFLVAPSLIFAEKNVVIDPGHGGWDTGTSGYSGNSTNFYEKHANLKISLYLRDKLEAEGFKVYMTRTDNDTYLSLEERVKKANGFIKGVNDQSVFVSVHHNAAPTNPYHRGFETYYYDKAAAWDPQWPPDPIQVGYVNDSKRLAYSVHPNVVNLLNMKDNGVRNYEAFYVIRNAQMPSVLLEMGYLSNPTEEEMIKTQWFQENAAESIKRGIIDYFKVFEVYSVRDERLKTYKSKEEAISYSQSVKNTYVLDKYKQEKIYENTNEYSVYQKSNDKLKTFTIKADAIHYAEGIKNTRVVDEDAEAGSILWSNYLPKKYSVHTDTGLRLNTFYDLASAISYAKTKDYPTQVKDINRVEVIWTNISGLKVTRTIQDKSLIGKERFQTAVQVSKELYPNGFDSTKERKTVVLANAYNFADALSVGPLAAQLDNAPILLTEKERLHSDVENEIKRLGAEEVYVIGGTAALSPTVENRLKAMNLKVTRLGAADRYQTNLLINKQLKGVQGVFVASGTNYADALGAAPIAAANNWAILLTDQNKISNEALTFINGKKVKILGGGAAISSTVEGLVKQQSTNVVRLAGQERYETLAKILHEFSSAIDSNQVAVSTGTDFPDALTASSLSVKSRAPLILVGDELSPYIYDYILEYTPSTKVNKVFEIGGKVEESPIEQIKNVLY
ncbi:N-acetylmuramoyl-L-alanine amidase [Rossellomorea aquimaris]|uniref:cell wall-binding repeat-containing protein n=1 Tax=Rossellomorea aquimaris TaxID=189382 RepID=UPI001CD73AB1|nr:cell wall-binding repeat-containing protein [Rossellomorea aquimaris]MCA1060798.1 N-acetylmuramoyl-L-alanine amidase [Rossellomorea aquimaris]